MNLKDCYDKYLNSKFSITEECIENALIYHLINKLKTTMETPPKKTQTFSFFLFLN